MGRNEQVWLVVSEYTGEPNHDVEPALHRGAVTAAGGEAPNMAVAIERYVNSLRHEGLDPEDFRPLGVLGVDLFTLDAPNGTPVAIAAVDMLRDIVRGEPRPERHFWPADATPAETVDVDVPGDAARAAVIARHRAHAGAFTGVLDGISDEALSERLAVELANDPFGQMVADMAREDPARIADTFRAAATISPEYARLAETAARVLGVEVPGLEVPAA